MWAQAEAAQQHGSPQRSAGVTADTLSQGAALFNIRYCVRGSIFMNFLVCLSTKDY